ncbi:MAG: cysteine--tRNA ligase [Clostridiales bacterium]|nr:cysteine--tRNA ligase [Clostridiales bacterium]
MSLRMYNTLSKQKENFTPLSKGNVGIYCCGPTTYNYIHLGNARPFVVFDTIRRYLRYLGYQVRFVQNFTDIDDKIIRRAAEEGLSPAQIGEKYIAAYFEDAARLNILPADIHPKVTEHIPEIISLVEGILAAGHAYVAEGDIYFDVKSFPKYGILSGRDLEEMQAGARVEPGELKRNPLDFALWKAAKPGEPAWKSPWGEGRPGWHIECSAMSSKYLGADFDIHGGGVDLIFPHHENEIAQAVAGNGGSFARYWLHNGFITINQEKMSKSLGNFFLLRDILDHFPGDVVRFYLLSTHYRSPIDFSDDKIAVAQKSLERIRTSYFLLMEADKRSQAGGMDEDFRQKIVRAREAFAAAMNDDFNTALAIGGIFDFCHELNAWLQGQKQAPALTLQEAVELFAEFDQVLGMILPAAKADQDNSKEIEGLINLLMEVRRQAREKKDWTASDQIRDGLKELGIIVEDTREGMRWKKL